SVMSSWFGGGSMPSTSGLPSLPPPPSTSVVVPSSAAAAPPPNPISSISAYLPDFLKDNPYFNAGAGLAGMGMAASLARRFAVIGNAYFRRRFMLTLQVNNRDAVYPWLLEFINKYSAAQTRHFTANSTIKQAESGKTDVSINYLPSFGTHFFTYKWRWIKCERQREEQVVDNTDGYRVPLETVTLTTLGTDSRFFRDMVQYATKEAQASTETGLVIYNAVGPDWRKMSVGTKRPLESVILRHGQAESMLEDMQQFLQCKTWYQERGIPYRRGYLLYGPPGTGKSSFIAAVAAHFGYSVCTLSLSDRTMDDFRLNRLLNSTPPSSVLVLEDIDAAFGDRAKDDPMNDHPAYQGLTRVTLSGLLNSLDGIGNVEERILFMTTNYIERLDAALIRPGRVDRKEFIDYADGEMLGKLFYHFYKPLAESDFHLMEEFIAECAKVNQPISMAMAQGHLLLHKTQPRRAIETAREALSTPERNYLDGK
ncbi:hypothetical protein PENTCL1PPCAC_7781, partial [Pristionchus entomophagus]